MRIKKVKILYTNIFYLEDEKNKILIDSGYPLSEKRFFEKIIEFNDIDFLILTHTHFDHAGNASYLKRKGVKVIVHSEEESWLRTGETPPPPGIEHVGKFVMRFARLKSFKFAPVEPDIVVYDSLKLGDFFIVHTPGHTPGSISVVYRDIAFCGDLVMNLAWRPTSHLPIFAHDIGLVKESIDTLKKIGVTLLYPAHGRALKLNELKI